MENKKNARNKTIDFGIEEGKEFLRHCAKIKDIHKEEEAVNKILIGDHKELARFIPPKSIDLMIADPPYNLSKEFHGEKFSKQSFDSYEEYTRNWLQAMLPLLKESASVYVCCDWESGLVIGRVLEEQLFLRNRITWQREKGRGAKTNWKNGMEDIYFGTLSNNYTFRLDDVKIRRKVIAPYRENGLPKDWTEDRGNKFRDTCPSNFWDDISIPFWSMSENTAHPTQKPEKLIAKMMLASSNKGDTVLDPFGGSGTTAVVAKKLGRNFISVEKNPLYCAWAQKRLENAEKDRHIQGYEDGVFWERNTLQSRKKRKD